MLALVSCALLGCVSAFTRPASVARVRVGVQLRAVEREEYTAFGSDGKEVFLSTQEKERVFVDAIQSYYFSGRQLLADADFDQLKDDLAWEGSDYAVLSRNETLFLSAMAAFNSGTPLLGDAEFDELKTSLKAMGSIVAVSKEPRCFLDTGICSVTFAKDNFREIVLYVPSVLIATLLWSGGLYELLPVSRSLNPLLTLVIGTPLIWNAAQYITEKLIFNDPLIATGPCPNCNVNNRIFFGDILGVEGSSTTADVQCTNCQTALTVTRANLRVSTAMSKTA